MKFKRRNFRQSSRLVTGIGWALASGPRPHFSSALLAGRLHRRPLGLSPHAQYRDRPPPPPPPPPPSAATLNSSRSGGSCGDGETSRLSFGDSEVLLFCGDIYLFRAAISLLFFFFCRASLARSRGRHRFFLATSLGGVAFSLFHPLRLASSGYEYGTTAGRTAVFARYNTPTKTRVKSASFLYFRGLIRSSLFPV